MNKTNLRKLRQFERGKRIVMTHYWSKNGRALKSPKKVIEGVCSTAGCHAGWETIRINKHIGGWPGIAWMISAESLGLNEQQAEFLFTAMTAKPNDSRRIIYCSPEEAAERLNILIEKRWTGTGAATRELSKRMGWSRAEAHSPERHGGKK